MFIQCFALLRGQRLGCVGCACYKSSLQPKCTPYYDTSSENCGECVCGQQRHNTKMATVESCHTQLPVVHSQTYWTPLELRQTAVSYVWTRHTDIPEHTVTWSTHDRKVSCNRTLVIAGCHMGHGYNPLTRTAAYKTLVLNICKEKNTLGRFNPYPLLGPQSHLIWQRPLHGLVRRTSYNL